MIKKKINQQSSTELFSRSSIIPKVGITKSPFLGKNEILGNGAIGPIYRGYQVKTPYKPIALKPNLIPPKLSTGYLNIDIADQDCPLKIVLNFIYPLLLELSQPGNPILINLKTQVFQKIKTHILTQLDSTKPDHILQNINQLKTEIHKLYLKLDALEHIKHQAKEKIQQIYLQQKKFRSQIIRLKKNHQILPIPPESIQNFSSKYPFVFKPETTALIELTWQKEIKPLFKKELNQIREYNAIDIYVDEQIRKIQIENSPPPLIREKDLEDYYTLKGLLISIQEQEGLSVLKNILGNQAGKIGFNLPEIGYYPETQENFWISSEIITSNQLLNSLKNFNKQASTPNDPITKIIDLAGIKIQKINNQYHGTIKLDDLLLLAAQDLARIAQTQSQGIDDMDYALNNTFWQIIENPQTNEPVLNMGKMDFDAVLVSKEQREILSGTNSLRYKPDYIDPLFLHENMIDPFSNQNGNQEKTYNNDIQAVLNKILEFTSSIYRLDSENIINKTSPNYFKRIICQCLQIAEPNRTPESIQATVNIIYNLARFNRIDPLDLHQVTQNVSLTNEIIQFFGDPFLGQVHKLDITLIYRLLSLLMSDQQTSLPEQLIKHYLKMGWTKSEAHEWVTTGEQKASLRRLKLSLKQITSPKLIQEIQTMINKLETENNSISKTDIYNILQKINYEENQQLFKRRILSFIENPKTRKLLFYKASSLNSEILRYLQTVTDPMIKAIIRADYRKIQHLITYPPYQDLRNNSVFMANLDNLQLTINNQNLSNSLILIENNTEFFSIPTSIEQSMIYIIFDHFIKVTPE